jgi:hypothetical protein
MDPHRSWTPPPPAFASDEQAADMVELYWLALTRDIPYAEYQSNSLTAQACADLTKFGPFRQVRFDNAVTLNTIFRAPLPGCSNGPYVFAISAAGCANRQCHRDLSYTRVLGPRTT